MLLDAPEGRLLLAHVFTEMPELRDEAMMENVRQASPIPAAEFKKPDVGRVQVVSEPRSKVGEPLTAEERVTWALGKWHVMGSIKVFDKKEDALEEAKRLMGLTADEAARKDMERSLQEQGLDSMVPQQPETPAQQPPVPLTPPAPPMLPLILGKLKSGLRQLAADFRKNLKIEEVAYALPQEEPFSETANHKNPMTVPPGGPVIPAAAVSTLPDGEGNGNTPPASGSSGKAKAPTEIVQPHVKPTYSASKGEISALPQMDPSHLQGYLPATRGKGHEHTGNE